MMEAWKEGLSTFLHTPSQFSTTEKFLRNINFATNASSIESGHATNTINSPNSGGSENSWTYLCCSPYVTSQSLLWMLNSRAVCVLGYASMSWMTALPNKRNTKDDRLTVFIFMPSCRFLCDLVRAYFLCPNMAIAKSTPRSHFVCLFVRREGCIDLRKIGSTLALL